MRTATLRGVTASQPVIDRYRNRGLTKPFTADVLARAGVSDSLIPRTIQALQTLELIGEDGNPTETLEGLRRAPEPEFKGQLAAWIRSVYADVLAFADPTDDETKIRDAFRSYNPVGQQPRTVALFIGLCRVAGLRNDDATKESRPRPKARKTGSGVTGSGVVARAATGGSTARSASRTTSLVEVADESAGLPPAIAGVIKSLPISGEWTKADRERFLTAFTAVLDFSIKVVAEQVEGDSDE